VASERGDEVNIGNIGTFLRQARKEKGLTQGNVADALGVSAQAVSKWERGENLPDVTYFPDLAKLYDCGVEQILQAGRDEPERQFDNLLKRVQSQMDDVLNSLFDDDGDYEYALDELLPYTNAVQRRKIAFKILEREEYGNLELMTAYMSSELKSDLLGQLLAISEYEAIEDIMPTLTRKHRDIIAGHFEQTPTDLSIIENFIPFFDKYQLERIRRTYYESND